MATQRSIRGSCWSTISILTSLEFTESSEAATIVKILKSIIALHGREAA